MVTKGKMGTSSKYSRRSIQTIAERIAAALNYSEAADIKTVVQRIGGKVKTVDFWNEENEGDGSLVVASNGLFEIKIPAHTNADRDNFTIAHELGHYFLHYQIAGVATRSHNVFQANRYGSGRKEWEANWFAAAFLMPENRFREVFGKYGPNFTKIAQHFKVSESAARVRAKALGLIDGQTRI